MIKRIIIPDKLFSKLWKIANKHDDYKEFVWDIMNINSNNYINIYKEIGLDEIKARTLLINIHKASKITVSDMVELSGLKKVQIAEMFCVPIRTFEDWCAGKAKCADYMRLSMIKFFRLLDLGKWIILESELYYEENAPRKERKSSRKTSSKNLEEEFKEKTEKNNNDIIVTDIIDKEYRKLEEERRIRKSQSDARSILRETDYLKRIMERNK